MVEGHWLLNGVVSLKTRRVLPQGNQRGNNIYYRIYTRVEGCQSSLDGKKKEKKRAYAWFLRINLFDLDTTLLDSKKKSI